MRHIKRIDEFFGLFKKKKNEPVDNLPMQTDIQKELAKLLIMPGSYHINKDYTVDVYKNVNLCAYRFSKFPVSFGIIDGDFICSAVGLETLEGAPRKVKGDFNCRQNKITSLKGSPIEIDGEFNCTNNQLVDLVGGPTYVGRDYNCSRNNLESLKGCPDEIYGNFYCMRNNLETLSDGPAEIEGDWSLINNDLKKLDSIANVKGDIYCGLNDIDPDNNGFMGWCGGNINFDTDDFI